MRVLLIFPGALGDLLLLAPAAAALVRRGVRVEWSVRRALADLVCALSAGALAPPVDGAAMSSLFTVAPAPALAEWLVGADQVHAWLGSDGGASALAHHVRTHAAGALLRFHGVARGDGPRHASMDYAAALGVDGPLEAPSLVLPVGSASPAWEAPWPARLVVHPGAGAVAKCWAASGFERVADRWHARGGDVTVLLGPAEVGMVERWRRTGHRLAHDLEILGAAARLASAPAYLGNDSGISHLAGVLRRTGVVLFGPTRPARWSPLGGALAPLDFTSRSPNDDAAAILERMGDPSGCRYLDTPQPEH